MLGQERRGIGARDYFYFWRGVELLVSVEIDDADRTRGGLSSRDGRVVFVVGLDGRLGSWMRGTRR